MAQSRMQYRLDKVGTDTEMFLRDIETNNPVPVIGLIGGTKANPKPVPELGDGFCVQEDNVMLEYNVPPAKTKTQFVNNIMTMNQYLDDLVWTKGLRTDICESMMFTKQQLNHPQAQDIGCEADMDVWNRLVNPSPKGNPLLQTTRSAGGHVHISFRVGGKFTDNLELKEPLVKCLDITIGFPLYLKYPEGVRRQIYGRPGAFRDKDYGIEYRVPDNRWTRSPAEIEWMWIGVEKAFYLLNHHQKLLSNQSDILLDSVKEINKGLGQRADEYLRYVLTMYGLMDRVPGERPHQDSHSQVDWSAFVERA